MEKKKETINSSSDLLSKIKTPLIYGTFGIVMFILIIIILVLLFSNSSNLDLKGVSPSAQPKDVETAFIIISVLFSILFIAILVLPNFKDLFTLLSNLNYVLFIILYIIGLLIFYRSVSPDTINKYANIILPISLLLGVFLFYKSINSSTGIMDLNLERIKYAITYFCLIVTMLIFYTIDPGGYIKQYFGPTFVITILLAVFGFLYLITIMTFPKTGRRTGTTGTGGFKLSSIVSVGVFLLFLILVTAGILSYKGGFPSGSDAGSNDKTGKVPLIYILLILVFILWIGFFVITMFSDSKLTTPTGEIDSSLSNISNIGKRVFSLLFGFIFSSILIVWLVNSVQNLSSQSGIVSFILNFLIVVAILGIVFKLLSSGSYYEKNPFSKFIINSIFYIPCLFVSFIDFFIALISRISTTSTITSIKVKETTTYYTLFGLIVLLYIIYFTYPYFEKRFSKQGGTQLVNKPVYINNEQSIGTYQELNKSDEFDYKYAISCWVFIDASTTNSSQNKYTSILNYGEKPNIFYNGEENSMMITMKKTTTGEKEELDSNGNIIVCKIPNVLLQKWNNIIINYTGGTLDIFYNGELIKSVIEIVPYMEYDTLNIGTENGIDGGICNVVYFNKNLDITQIYNLYNSVKNTTPPVISDSDETIIQLTK